MRPVFLSKRVRQPQQSLPIDWLNPITRELALLFDFSGGGDPREIKTNRTWPQSTHNKTATKAGIGQTITSAGTAQAICPVIGTSNTILVFCNPPADVNPRPIYVQRPSGGGSPQFAFIANMDRTYSLSTGKLTLADGSTVNGIEASGVIDGNPHWFLATRSATTGQIYVDGIPVITTITGTQASATGVGIDSYLGFHAGLGTSLNSTIVFCAVWNRELSPTEARQISLNPWQLFQPQQELLFDVISGGGINTPVNPGIGALAFTGYIPSVTQSTNQSLTSGVGNLGITGYAPTISQPQAITAGAGGLTVTGFAPTVTQGITTNIVPSAGSLTLISYVPSIVQSANQAVNPSVESLAITGYIPALSQTANQALLPSAGAMVVTGYAPTVTQQSSSPNLILSIGQIIIAGFAPDVTQSSPQRLGGFEMVSMEPTWRRALRLRAEHKEKKQKVELARKQRKRAELLEKLAAQEALSAKPEKNIETRLDTLLSEWIALAPKLDSKPIEQVSEDTAYRAFMTRVAAQIKKIEDEDDESAAEMLLLM